jgi:hypothetical protein
VKNYDQFEFGLPDQIVGKSLSFRSVTGQMQHNKM